MGTALFEPDKLWSDIDYVEIMSVAPTMGLLIEYNSITVAPGLKIYPTGGSTWQYTLFATRSELGCDSISEIWSVRVKLFGYQITDETTFEIGFSTIACDICTTTTTTTIV
jgi:hypothetical protein